MKIAYIHPRFPDTLWSFRGIGPFFFNTLWKSSRGHFSIHKFMEATSFMTLHKHFHEYIKIHGDPRQVAIIFLSTTRVRMTRHRFRYKLEQQKR